MTEEMMGFWNEVESAGPYANNLHLQIATPTPHDSIFTGRLLFLMPKPAVSKH